MIRRLGIVGVGLIGGSLGLAARRAGIAHEIVGLGRSRENLAVALERGLVDRAETDPAVLADADLVVLATPVGSLARAANAIAPLIAEGAIVTDAGSVKASVVAECSRAFGARARFVGGHPIAGTEESGAAAADADLFRGARCVLTPVAATDRAALLRVRELWEQVGMDVVEMSPEDHDRLLALTSHLPHLLAFALALAAEEHGAAGGPRALEFAGPSFRSATRVAASSPEMWRDVLSANAPAVRAALDDLRARLDGLTAAAEAGAGDDLLRMLARARATRRRLDTVGEPDGSRHAFPAAEAAVCIEPAAGPLRGDASVPGDKSIAHRGLLFGGIARGATVVHGVGRGEDNASTIHVLRALGVGIERAGDVVRIEGKGFDGLREPAEVLDCGNSGTTMRLAVGLLAARPFDSRLDGDTSLRLRPMQRLIDPLTAMGAEIESTGGRPPLAVHGRTLRAGRFDLPVASAQVKTALLLAALQTEGVTTVGEPAPSRDHTERLLPAFGAVLERPSALSVSVCGPQELRGTTVLVPGDPSAAVFWLVAASIVPGSRVRVCGVGVNPTRTGAIDVLRAMGARITLVARDPVGDEPVADLEVEAAPLRGVVVEGDTMLRAIDEFPALSIAAACASGETRFADAAELRVKESDRIAAMGAGLARLGGRVEERPDGMAIRGPLHLRGGEVDSHGDHRIAMSWAVAALVASGPVVIRGADAIAVSDPGFLEALARLRHGGA